MASDILDRAAAAIDGKVMFGADGRPFGLGLPTDGLGGSHELGDGVTMIESFAHDHVVETDSAAVVFDSSVPDLWPRVAERVRAETRLPVSHLVLTHGHRDHAGGAAALINGLAGAEQLATACHLIDLAAAADPDSATVHAIRADIYWQRRAEQQSVMAAAIYESTARESAATAARIDLPTGADQL